MTDFLQTVMLCASLLTGLPYNGELPSYRHIWGDLPKRNVLTPTGREYARVAAVYRQEGREVVSYGRKLPSFETLVHEGIHVLQDDAGWLGTVPLSRLEQQAYEAEPWAARECADLRSGK